MSESAQATGTAASSRAAAVFLGCAAMVQHGVVLQLVGPVLPDLMREFSVRESLAGLMLSIGSLGFVLGPLVVGRLIDSRGLRVALLSGLVIELAALCAFGFTPAFAFAMAFSFLLRFGASFVETSVNVLPVILPGARGASLMNLMHAFFGVGSLLSPISVGLLVQLTGRWRVAFVAGAAVTAAMLAFAGGVRLPQAAASQRPAAEEAGRSRPATVLDSFVLAGALALFLYVGAEVGMSAWIVLYLRERLGFAPVAATAGATLLWVGIMIGRSLNSLLSRRIGVRALVLGGAVAGAVSGFALLTVRSGSAIYALLFLFGLTISGTFPNVVISVNTRYPDRVGQVTAALTVASAAGGMSFHVIIGALSQVLGIVSIIAIPPTLLALLAITYGMATRRHAAALR